MTQPTNNSPDQRLEAAVRLARRLKRQRDEASKSLADTGAQLEAFEALLAGAFPPQTENP